MNTVLASLNPFANRSRSSAKQEIESSQAARPDPLMAPLQPVPAPVSTSTLRFIQDKNSQSTFTTPPTAVPAVIPASTRTPSQAPTRISVFKSRIKVERAHTPMLPFALDGDFVPLRFDTSATTLQPAQWMLADYLQWRSQHPLPSQQDRQARCVANWQDALAALRSLQQPDAAPAQSILLQLAPASGVQWCDGLIDCLSEPVDTDLIRVCHETDGLRLQGPGSHRVAQQDLTAQHSLRERGVADPAFAGWFEEEGFACAPGVSPVETFVQAQLLFLQHHSQKIINQMRRLSAHLHTHCRGLDPMQCVLQSHQADAYLQRWNEAPHPGLYALLTCELNHPDKQAGEAGGAGQTVHDALGADPMRGLHYRDIQWPQTPVALLLMTELAELAATDDASPDAGGRLQALAVLDTLLRQPGDTGCDVRLAPAHRLSEDNPTLLAEIRQRFSGLLIELKARGLR